MIQTSEEIGKYIRDRRKKLGITQKRLALTSGTGIRFIIDLEKGKPTCHFGKVLRIVNMLGMKMELVS
ncbi:transcriptional regulator [bacterium]|nr:transcriptional regulator [bacterium]